MKKRSCAIEKGEKVVNNDILAVELSDAALEQVIGGSTLVPPVEYVPVDPGHHIWVDPPIIPIHPIVIDPPVVPRFHHRSKHHRS